ncbi:MAG: TetR/AcrR family transcriptional regulator [Candidatus Borkfalkiaceae bacterium]|nr:TetR/AcrR family transcriptional regulator [Christensenellaceae bacterium]
MTSTKQAILDVSLDLFSTNGFEATSIGQIADAVGIRKSSLYSHFESKQEILDTLIADISVQFEKGATFFRKGEDLGEDPVKTVVDRVREQIRFVLHDSRISKVRKLMIIEQFRNPQISDLQTKHVYSDLLACNLALVNDLVAKSVLKNEDPEIMAAQFTFPISTWLNLCDREPEREEEVMQLIGRHIRQFFRIYRA